MAYRLKSHGLLHPWLLLSLKQTRVQATKEVKIVKGIGRESLHGREIKKENGHIVKKNRCGCERLPVLINTALSNKRYPYNAQWR
jgi:hypothetical protein